jgi:hypothetical protein
MLNQRKEDVEYNCLLLIIPIIQINSNIQKIIKLLTYSYGFKQAFCPISNR